MTDSTIIAALIGAGAAVIVAVIGVLAALIGIIPQLPTTIKEFSAIIKEIIATIKEYFNIKPPLVEQPPWGHSACSIIRRLGQEDWTFDEVRNVFDSFEGLTWVNDTTIRIQLKKKSKPANLAGEQLMSLIARKKELAVNGTFTKDNEDSDSPPPPKLADKIRQYTYEEYIKPALAAGKSSVTVRAGDVHAGMGLPNHLPAVCSALETKLFLDQYNLTLVSRDGPIQGANVYFTYAPRSSVGLA